MNNIQPLSLFHRLDTISRLHFRGLSFRRQEESALCSSQACVGGTLLSDALINSACVGDGRPAVRQWCPPDHKRLVIPTPEESALYWDQAHVGGTLLSDALTHSTNVGTAAPGRPARDPHLAWSENAFKWRRAAAPHQRQEHGWGFSR